MAHQIEDKNEYKKIMKDRAATLYCPFEECCDHGKTERGNIVFVRKKFEIHESRMSCRLAEGGASSET